MTCYICVFHDLLYLHLLWHVCYLCLGCLLHLYLLSPVVFQLFMSCSFYLGLLWFAPSISFVACLLFVSKLFALFASFVFCSLPAIYIFHDLLCLYFSWLVLSASSVTCSICVFCSLFAIYASSAPSVSYMACLLGLYLTCPFRPCLLFFVTCLLFVFHLLHQRLPWLASFVSSIACLIYFSIISLNQEHLHWIMS